MPLEPSIHVLHVDDKPGSPELTATRLERMDDRFKVTTARTADEAIREFHRTPVDCIVSEYDLGDQTGLDILHAVRDTDPTVPFILFTGRGSESIASDAISAGVTDYLQKDTIVDQYTVLLNRITNAVEQYRTRTQLDQREELLYALFEHSSDWTCVTDDDGVFQFVSPAVTRLFGWAPDALEGTNWRNYVHADDKQTIADTLEKVTASADNVYTAEYRFESQTDGWRWLETRLVNCIDNPAIGGIITNTRDITERKTHRHQIKTLHDVAEALNTCSTPQAVYDLLVDAAEDVLDYDLAIADEAVGDILVPRAVEMASGDEEFFNETPIDADDNVAAEVYRSGEAIVVNDLTARNVDPADARYRSALTVPIGTHGIFQTVSTEPFTFSEQDVELVEILVSHAETVLNRLAQTQAVAVSQPA